MAGHSKWANIQHRKGRQDAGCIGMGQAPASGRNSLRTVPRNFPGRSGTSEDSVFLCSPETATASALEGRITDPRKLNMDYPKIEPPDGQIMDTQLLVAPLSTDEAKRVELVKGPNIASLPDLDAIPDEVELPVILKVGDDISTDEISPAGGRALPFRSNIPRISEFAFDVVDDGYVDRARKTRDEGGHVIIGGDNYGQGSSREHAALAPRFLGLRVVVARSFARIHWQNLINFGILPLTFDNPDDYESIGRDDRLRITDIHDCLHGDGHVAAEIKGRGERLKLRHQLSAHQAEVLATGGVINWLRQRQNDGQHQIH